MSQPPPEYTGPTFIDRRGWLIGLGNVLILFGAWNLLQVAMNGLQALMIIGMSMGEYNPETAAIMPFFIGYFLAIVAFWGVTAVVQIWLGIGSIMCRRWAQKLLWVGGWVWAGLQFYILLTIAYGVIELMPLMLAGEKEEAEMRGFMAIAMGVMMLFYTVFTLVPPLLFGWFYGTENVRLTCEWRDRQPRWTDRVPPVVLSLAVLTFTLLPMAFIASMTRIFPYGSTVLIGPPAVGMWALLLVVGIYLVWGLTHRRRGAWMLALALVLVVGGPLVASFGLIDFPQTVVDVVASFDPQAGQEMLAEFTEAANDPASPDHAMIKGMSLVPYVAMFFTGGLTLTYLILLLLCTRHFFGARKPEA